MIKAKINATGEVVNVRPYQTEIYDFMVCRSGGIMGELYMRSELTIIGDNEFDFVSLVKRMREAQKEFKSDSLMDFDKTIEVYRDKFHLESEVDEYLKKMDSIDKRKALEAENTEFDYGHNVKHYIEELWKI